MKKAGNRTEHNSRREIDYLKIAGILLSRWYILAGMLLTAILIAQAYLWYTPKTYATTGILKLEEKKSELSDLVNVMSNSGRSPANLQSEKFIIQSRSLLLNAIKRLDYKISFFISGRIRNYDLYPKTPLQIRDLKFDSLSFFREPITFRSIDQRKFSLSWKRSGGETQQTFNYNSPVTVENISFIINYGGPVSPGVSYLFRFNSPEQLLDRVIKGLKTSEASKNANILTLQQTDSNPHFAADVLNAVMSEYLDYDQHQKTQSATQMIRFITEQQANLSGAVKGSESSMEKYKQNSGIMDVEAAATNSLSKLSELESQRALLNIQLIAIEQLKQQITTDKDNVSLNFNLEGSVDPLLGTLIGSLNELLKDKNLLLKTYHNTATPVSEINREIAQLKAAALQNINASHQRIHKNISYLSSQTAQFKSQAAVLPAAEKDMISLRRDFAINEKVYSFLSEKKLEAEVNKSAILPGATIIEKARVNAEAVSPDPAKVYRTAVILGLLAGLTSIVLARTLNPYIYDKRWVENATNIPIIGIIRKFPDKIDENNSQILALVKPRSIFAESVRAVRTNLNFLASDKKSKVICVTSDVAGEGKSFVALNLSSTLALIHKKVILIGADLRRPKIHKAFRGTNHKGLSNYLIGQCGLDDIIQHSENGDLDFISSGPVPPNPAELLLNEHLTTLLEALKERYEMIIIDTAPIGLVSDTIPLIRKSDINLFVIRYGKSTYSAAHVPQGLAGEYGLKNMTIVLNGFTENRLQSSFYKNANEGSSHYYADYNRRQSSGYYENEEKRKWWRRR